MRLFRAVAGCIVLLLGACGGGDSTTSSSASDAVVAVGAEVTLEACPGTSPGLFAVEPSGTLRWSRCDDKGSYQLITVAIADGLAYIVEQSGEAPTLLALDVDGGTEVWRYTFSSLNDGFGYDALYASDRASFAAGGVIVLDVPGDNGSDLVGLDAQSGEERWHVADDGGRVVTLKTDDLVVTGVAFGGELAGDGPTGSVVAYDRQSGEQRWLAADVPYFGGGGGARVAGDTMVLQLWADAAPAGVMGIDLETGEERWRHDDQFWLQSAGDDAVLGVAGDVPMSGVLLALAPDDGTELWRASASSFTAAASTQQDTATNVAEQAAMPPWMNTLTVDTTVVAQVEQVVVGFDARSGDERWRRETPLRILSGGAGNALLHGMQSGLELIRIDDGATVWSASFSADTVAQAAIASDLVVLSLAHIDMEGPVDTASGQTYVDPAKLSVGCTGGTVLTGAFIPPIGPGSPVSDLTVLVSADKSNFCVINSSGVEDMVPFEPGQNVNEPEVTVVQGTLTNYLVVAVPAKWGQNPQVSVAGGQPLSSAVTRDGTVMLIVDYAPLGSTPDQYVDRTFTFTDFEGQILEEVTVSAPPTGSMEDVVACLAQHGANVAPQGMPNTAPPDEQPLDPAVASAAWTACRPNVLLFFEMSGQNLPEGALETLDCMASKGFFQLFGGGEVDAAAKEQALSECEASLPLGPGGLRCNVYTIGTDGALSNEPVRRNLLGFGMGAKATATATATVGQHVTVTIPAQETDLIDSATGYEILEHSAISRTFTVTGATIVPGSLIQDPPTDATAETTATATDSTVSLDWVTPIARSGDVTFPAAHFDIVASSPGTANIVFTSYDSTMQLQSPEGVETPVRVLCTTDDRIVTAITVS